MTDLARASQDFMRAAQKSTVLYELSAEYVYLLDLLDDPDVDPHLIEQELERVAGEIRHKAGSIAALIRQCEGLAEMRRSEAKRLADSATKFERKAEWLRTYVFTHMTAMDIERIDTDRFTLSIQNNPPHVEVLQPSEVPHEYQRTKITVDVDKSEVLKHYKATGEMVPGVDIVRGKKLVIR
jgi:Siphovirus Gp157